MNTELNAGRGNVQGKKEALVEDIKSVVVDADGLLKEMTGAGAEKFTEARTKIEGRLHEAKSRLGNARLVVSQRARHVAGATNDYVKENPWRVLGIAAAAGFITGFLISRR